MEDVNTEAANTDNTEEAAATEQPITLAQDDELAAVQAILFANGEPISAERIAEVCSLTTEHVLNLLEELKIVLHEQASGIELQLIAGQYQLRTKPRFAAVLRRLRASAPKKLSAPALETLSIIAYRQPVVKSDIEKIRGVDATPTLKTLLDRNLIKIIGHQATVGQPALYGTTDEFLKIFGMGSLSELPTLRELNEIESDPGETEIEASDGEGAEVEVEEPAPVEADAADPDIAH